MINDPSFLLLESMSTKQSQTMGSPLKEKIINFSNNSIKISRKPAQKLKFAEMNLAKSKDMIKRYSSQNINSEREQQFQFYLKSAQKAIDLMRQQQASH